VWKCVHYNGTPPTHGTPPALVAQVPPYAADAPPFFFCIFLA
jgi:hypothetical protein